VRQGLGVVGKLAVGGIKLLRALGEEAFGLQPTAAFPRQTLVDALKTHACPCARPPVAGKRVRTG
jgi:hypothetical protein